MGCLALEGGLATDAGDDDRSPQLDDILEGAHDGDQDRTSALGLIGQVSLCDRVFTEGPGGSIVAAHADLPRSWIGKLFARDEVERIGGLKVGPSALCLCTLMACQSREHDAQGQQVQGSATSKPRRHDGECGECEVGPPLRS